MAKRQAIQQMQIGKNRLTEGFIEDAKRRFEEVNDMRICVLKSACRDKKEVKEMAEKIKSALGDKFTYRLIGYTICLKKWKKPVK